MLRSGQGRPTRRRRAVGLTASVAFTLAGCGGGGGVTGSGSGQGTPTVAVGTNRVFSNPAQEALTSAEVGRIIAQAVAEADARSKPAVIAVTDRVGNVLAVFSMTGANQGLAVPLPRSGTGVDLQGVSVPGAVAGAIAKAITGAYLSSAGNAFTTRTASEIVQEHFPPTPGAVGLESGPLFGVQFSQLPCSDLSARYDPAGGTGALIGPKRSPLGLSADPGGIPLYKNGVVVGGIGIMSDGVYGFDPDIVDVDNDVDEAIAQAGAGGFTGADSIKANRITVDGTSLRYADTAPMTSPNAGATFASVAARGALTPVRGYYAETGTPAVLAGTAYGTEASGIRQSTTAEFSNADAFVLTDGTGANRFPIIGGTDAGDVAQPLTAAEVRAILEEAFLIMSRARGQIRQPLDSRAQVSITVVDTRGVDLGLVRGPDAPIFGTDVALQKARTAAFFSGRNAATELSASGSADVRSFVGGTRTFLGDQNALTGTTAITARAVGNLARPYFPDGEVGRPNGPLSRPIQQWSPFSTGLQSALILGNVLQNVTYILGASATDTPRRCTDLPTTAGRARLANGIQIFPGSTPIYRGSTLIGAIGISGDGIDQDDMISFLGLSNAAARLNSGFGQAPTAIRADRIVVNDVRLRYVSCPFAPFVDTAEQNPCTGK